jgi:saccharopine dehydrogenase-like NADP-dependent oxidoreductase
MATIMIVGAGRVGLAAAKISLSRLDHSVALVDAQEGALEKARSELEYLEAPVSYHLATQPAALDQLFTSVKPDLVMCSTPFMINVQVAELAARHAVHYIDFTEDNEVTAAISKLRVESSTFVPQTGLAPGLVSYMGLELLGSLGEPLSLDLRVGALPQVAFGPAHYAITWSPEGLVNEYIKPAYRKVDGSVVRVEPLQDVERLLVNGVTYEGFTTAGGVGDLDAYPHIPSVEYKTLRHPGHLDFIKSVLLAGPDFTLEKGVARAKQLFDTTRDDVVVLAAHAVDTNRRSASVGLHFRPNAVLGLTALELTTAGTGVAVAELILAGKLPVGVLKPSQVPMAQLRKTQAFKLVASSAGQ